MKKYEELDITDPFIFAKVMSEKELCKPLLENILNIKIRDIVYVDYEETIQMTVKSKGIRLDIYVEDDNNTVFNLEMQTTTYKELPKRSRYYQGIIDLNMIEKANHMIYLRKVMSYLSVHLIFLKKEEVFTSLKMYAWKIVKSS